MKIILVGAQGTGKSTICSRLSKELDIELVDSISSRFIKDKSLFDNLYSIEYKNFQAKLFSYASDIYLNKESFISSRGFADSYAYLLHTYNKTSDMTYYYLSVVSEIFERSLQTQEDYHLFYTPIEFELENSNNIFRSQDIDFQREVDEYIRVFLKKSDIKYTKISGGIEDRLDIIRGVIR